MSTLERANARLERALGRLEAALARRGGMAPAAFQVVARDLEHLRAECDRLNRDLGAVSAERDRLAAAATAAGTRLEGAIAEVEEMLGS